MATVQYEYGLPKILSGGNVIDAELHRAHKYYNKLIEIELRRRVEMKEALLPYTQSIQTLEAEAARIGARIEVLRDELKRKSAAARKRVQSPETRAEIKTLEALRKPLWDRLKELRAELKLETKPPKHGETKPATPLWLAAEPVWRRAHEANLAARADCGCYSGTYQIVEAAAKAAKKSPDLNFKPWTGSGTVGSQVTQKLSTRDVFLPNTRITIDPVDPAAWVAPRGADLGPRPESERPQRLKRRTQVRIRVDSDEHGKPVWATFSLMLHRPLPERAVITWVKVQRIYTAGRYIWKLLLTMNVPDALPVTERPTMGIDLGWRKRPDGMRAAAWISSTGSMGTLVLPPSIQDRLDKADSIRSFRDQETDKMRAKLSPMMKALALPEAVRAAAKNMHVWKSGKHYERLMLCWYSHRCAGDGPALALLEAWRARRMHLWAYERGMRASALYHRRDLFRSFACCVAQTHGVVAIEDWNMTTVVEKPEAEEPDPVMPVSRRQRVVTGASLLRLALVSALHQAGATVVRVPVALTTLRCSYCGFINDFDKKNLEHTCTACGVRWDQDYNAARNLLAGAPTGARQPRPSERKAAFASRHKPKEDIGIDDDEDEADGSAEDAA